MRFYRKTHSHSNQLPKVLITSQETESKVNAIVCSSEVDKRSELVIYIS